MTFDPQQISYDEADIKRESARATLNEGWYKFAVDSAFIKEDKNRNIKMNTKVSPINPEDGETRMRPAMYYGVALPVRNPDVAGHTPPDYAKGFAREFLSALSPDEIPAEPKKVDGVWQYQGEDMDPSEYQEKKEEATKILLEAVISWSHDPQMFKDYTFFGKVVHSEDGQYVNIKNACAELPDGAELVAASDFVTRQETKTPAKAAPATKATTGKPNSKPVGKPVAKKKN